MEPKGRDSRPPSLEGRSPRALSPPELCCCLILSASSPPPSSLSDPPLAPRAGRGSADDCRVRARHRGPAQGERERESRKSEIFECSNVRRRISNPSLGPRDRGSSPPLRRSWLRAHLHVAAAARRGAGGKPGCPPPRWTKFGMGAARQKRREEKRREKKRQEKREGGRRWRAIAF